MHPVYRYDKTRAMFERAIEVIPSGLYGHQGPAEGCHIPPSAFPQFASRAKGSYFWDLDGNRFIDYMCAYGPNILGYGDPDVDEAAVRQMAVADCVTAPPSLIVDFAELLVETVASADWAFFAKNGGDVTTLAIMTARAHTRRKKNRVLQGLLPRRRALDAEGGLPGRPRGGRGQQPVRQLERP